MLGPETTKQLLFCVPSVPPCELQLPIAARSTPARATNAKGAPAGTPSCALVRRLS
jgi:hypothetical protein